MSDKITINDGQFSYKQKVYGPSDKILAYPGEETHFGTNKDVLSSKRTPEDIDILFAVDTKVAGCEVKTYADLINSWKTRRLQRQLRTLRDSCDIAILIIRGGMQLIKYSNTHIPAAVPDKLFEDLINLQTMGVYVVNVPRSGYLPYIFLMRRSLASSGFRALAGTDQKKLERAEGWILRRIPGIGIKRSVELRNEYKSNWAVFQAARAGKLASTFGVAIERAIQKALKE